jgi:hypothetical protein
LQSCCSSSIIYLAAAYAINIKLPIIAHFG